MMRTIARRISEGGFVLPALAGELGVEQGALGERLFMMERLGFVERRGGCEPAGAPSCRHCAGCCGGTGLPGGVRYTLTEKGRRLAGVPPTKPKED